MEYWRGRECIGGDRSSNDDTCSSLPIQFYHEDQDVQRCPRDVHTQTALDTETRFPVESAFECERNRGE